jgi:hypothetical protein
MCTNFLLFSHACTAKVTGVTILGVGICFHASCNETGECNVLSIKLTAPKQMVNQLHTFIHGENTDTPKNTSKIP